MSGAIEQGRGLMTPFAALLWGWGGMAVVMTLLWIVQKVRGDAGIVDAAWAAGIGALSVFFAVEMDGDPRRRIAVACVAGLWAVRLARHVLVRVLTMPEDGRYTKLREQWGEKAQAYLFGFFQLQAFWAVLFAAPMLIASRNPKPFPSATDFAALAVWLNAVLGEAVADRQLQRFRRDPANRGKVCQAGLWASSRHPNYFFEWTHWFTYVLLSAGAPLWWLSLMGPALMLWFLLKVTGIPPTEEQALRSRGDAYREYQRTTNAFFPGPRKK